MPDVLISSETRSGGRTLLGRPRLLECRGICVLSRAHKLRGSGVYLHIVKKKKSANFSLNSARIRVLGWPFRGIFFSLGIFPFFGWSGGGGL